MATLHTGELTAADELTQALDAAQPLVHDQPERAHLLAELCAAARHAIRLPGSAPRRTT